MKNVQPEVPGVGVREKAGIISRNGDVRKKSLF